MLATNSSSDLHLREYHGDSMLVHEHEQFGGGRRRWISPLLLAGCLVVLVFLSPIRSEIWLRWYVDHEAISRSARQLRANCPDEGYLAKPNSTAYSEVPRPLQLGGVIAVSPEDVRIVFGSGFLHWGLVAHGPGQVSSISPRWRTVKLRDDVTFFSELGGRSE
ncbi:MAG: hypothetical protein KIT58_13570 [Planctomycetota bacterium]|nr:hypothetical protein [Planctomycetota bacterium]